MSERQKHISTRLSFQFFALFKCILSHKNRARVLQKESWKNTKMVGIIIIINMLTAGQWDEVSPLSQPATRAPATVIKDLRTVLHFFLWLAFYRPRVLHIIEWREYEKLSSNTRLWRVKDRATRSSRRVSVSIYVKYWYTEYRLIEMKKAREKIKFCSSYTYSLLQWVTHSAQAYIAKFYNNVLKP